MLGARRIPAVNYEHISEFKDKEGRFVMTIGNIEGTLVRLLNVYAPPGSDGRFYRQYLIGNI